MFYCFTNEASRVQESQIVRLASGRVRIHFRTPNRPLLDVWWLSFLLRALRLLSQTQAVVTSLYNGEASSSFRSLLHTMSSKCSHGVWSFDKSFSYRVFNSMENGAQKHRPWLHVRALGLGSPQCDWYPCPSNAMAVSPQKILSLGLPLTDTKLSLQFTCYLG